MGINEVIDKEKVKADLVRWAKILVSIDYMLRQVHAEMNEIYKAVDTND